MEKNMETMWQFSTAHNNSLPEFGIDLYFSWANLHVEHQSLVFDFFFVLFFDK